MLCSMALLRRLWVNEGVMRCIIMAPKKVSTLGLSKSFEKFNLGIPFINFCRQ